MVKEEANCRRKQEKVTAQSQCVSSEDSISRQPDLEDKDSLDSEESDVSSRRVKSVIKVPPHRQSLAPWDTNMESPPRKRARTESPRDRCDRSQESEDRSRHSNRDQSGPGASS